MMGHGGGQRSSERKERQREEGMGRVWGRQTD